VADRSNPAERRARRASVDDPAVVLDAAARYLESRSRSVAEVRRHLVGGGFRVALVEGAIERLTSLGYLDDRAFARAWVESRDRAHPRGARALRLELARKGIDEATIRAVLADRDAGDVGASAVDESPGWGARDRRRAAPRGRADDDAADRLLARKAAGLLRVADPRTRKQKAWALLARNGFDPEVARRAALRFMAGDGRMNGADASDEETGLETP
jgi:SOS response regulatory protein OraA/RecX